MLQRAAARACLLRGDGNGFRRRVGVRRRCERRCGHWKARRTRRQGGREENAKGGKDLSRSPYLFTTEEIVGARFAAHDLVIDGKLRPHDLRHDLLCGLTAARSATRWVKVHG